jgi:hypothetical protein
MYLAALVTHYLKKESLSRNYIGGLTIRENRASRSLKLDRFRNDRLQLKDIEIEAYNSFFLENRSYDIGVLLPILANF